MEGVKMEHTFRSAEFSDIDAVFQLYKKRIQWMNEKGIWQWNEKTGYMYAILWLIQKRMVQAVKSYWK